MQVGDKLPLFIAASDYSTSSFCQAFVRDMLGNPLAGSPVAMTPDSTGEYSNTSLLMPNTPWVHAKYVFYVDSGFTTIDYSQGQGNATFELSGASGAGFPSTSNILGILDGDGCVPLPIQDTITQGSDRTLTVRLVVDDAGNPFDLTLATSIEFRFRNQDGTVLALLSTGINPPVTVVSAAAGQLACVLTGAQTALLATQIPAPFSVVVTEPSGVSVVNFPTQLAVEQADV